MFVYGCKCFAQFLTTIFIYSSNTQSDTVLPMYEYGDSLGEGK